MFYTRYADWAEQVLSRPGGCIREAVVGELKFYRAYAKDRYDGKERLRQIGVFGRMPGHGFLVAVAQAMYFYNRPRGVVHETDKDVIISAGD